MIDVRTATYSNISIQDFLLTTLRAKQAGGSLLPPLAKRLLYDDVPLEQRVDEVFECR